MVGDDVSLSGKGSPIYHKKQKPFSMDCRNQIAEKAVKRRKSPKTNFFMVCTNNIKYIQC